MIKLPVVTEYPRENEERLTWVQGREVIQSPRKIKALALPGEAQVALLPDYLLAQKREASLQWSESSYSGSFSVTFIFMEGNRAPSFLTMTTNAPSKISDGLTPVCVLY